MKNFVDLSADRAVVGVGLHDVRHKVPPFLRGFVTAARRPDRLVFNFNVLYKKV